MSQHRVVIEAGKENSRYWKDVLDFRGLFYYLSWRDVLVRYKQTTVGVAWAVVRPALSIFALSLVRWLFGADEKSGIPAALLVAAGTLPWQFFSSAFGEVSGSLLANANLVSKVYFPRIIIPASAVIVCLIDFLISLGIAIILMIYYGCFPGIQIVFLPVFLFLALISALGSGLYICALNVKYRDFKFIVPFIIQFGMYVSPVIYSSNEIYSNASIPVVFKYLYAINPMVSSIDGFRWCFFGDATPINWLFFSVSLVVSLLFLWLGIFTFRRMEKEFADVI